MSRTEAEAIPRFVDAAAVWRGSATTTRQGKDDATARLQRWWHQHRTRRDAARLLAALHLLSHWSLCETRVVDGAGSEPLPNVGHKFSLSDAAVVCRLCTWVDTYESKLSSLGGAHLYRPIDLRGGHASTGTTAYMSEAPGARTQAAPTPLRRRAHLLPSRDLTLLVASTESKAHVRETGEVDTPPRTPLANEHDTIAAADAHDSLQELQRTLGTAGCNWLLHVYALGKLWRSRITDPAATWPAVVALERLRHASGPAASSRPPHDPTSTTVHDAVEEAARPPTPMQARARQTLAGQSPTSSSETDTDEEGEGERDRDARYYARRREKATRLERTLRTRLGMGESADGASCEAGECAGGSRGPAQAESVELPAAGALRDVRVPILGQHAAASVDGGGAAGTRPLVFAAASTRSDGGVSARTLSRCVCAVCELDGTPFSSEVAEVDEQTIANDELLWPCNGCGGLIHWACSLDACLCEENGGSVRLYCSRTCSGQGVHAV